MKLSEIRKKIEEGYKEILCIITPNSSREIFVILYNFSYNVLKYYYDYNNKMWKVDKIINKEHNLEKCLKYINEVFKFYIPTT